MNANVYVIEDYENEPPSGPRKTNPIKPNFSTPLFRVLCTLRGPGLDSDQRAGILCSRMKPKLLNFHRKNSLTVCLNSVKCCTWWMLCNVDKRYRNMNLRVILEPSEEGGYTAIVPSLPGCLSEGDTREEALKNIREAIELYLESVEDDSSFAVDSEQLEIVL